MMYNNIDKLIADATLARDKELLSVLRLIKADLLKSIKDGMEMNDANEVKVLMKMVAQREDSVAQYKSVGRTDLVDNELKEIEIIKRYIPEQPKDEDVENYTREVVKDYLDKNGSDYKLSMKDMKPVMEIVKVKYNVPTVGKIVSNVIKSLI